MNGGVPKSRSHSKLSNTSQKALNAILSTGPELPQSHGEQSPASGDLARDAPVRSTKRRRDATSESDPVPSKRTRSTWTSTQPPRVEDEKAEQAAKTALQSKPKQPPKHPYAPSSEPKTEGLEQVSPATRLRKRQIGDGDGESRPELSRAELPPNHKEQVPAATPSRKRQIDSSSDDEPQPKRARLTRKNLALFDKMGRKKVPDSTDESGSTKTTSTTTSGFAIQARKNGILERGYSKPPKNLEDIRKRHTKTRATASPPESVYNDYVDKVEGAKNEATMVVETSGRMLKEYPKGYQRVFNQAFTGFPKDVGFNNGLSTPQPDFVEGLEMRGYLPFPIDEHVDGAALYQDDPRSVTLPHIAGEWKGRGKNMEEARLQSAYDGAALVFARNRALAYMGKSDPPGHAEITTFTTDGTNLNHYAHYATPSDEDGNTLEYHQYQYATTNVKDTYPGHKDGRKGLRNAQDHAREQSYALRDQLKEHWKQKRSTLNPIAEGASLPAPEVETTQYGDEAGYEIIGPPYQLTPATPFKPREASQSNCSSKASHHSSSDSQKRKASSSHTSSHGSSGHASKHRSYWKKDPETGRYYHRHSDGSVSWLDDGHDEDGY